METENKYGRCNACSSTNETIQFNSSNVMPEVQKRINNQVRVASSLFTMNLAALTYKKKSSDDYLPTTTNRTASNIYSGTSRRLRSRTREIASPGNSKYGSYDRYLLKKKKGYFVLDDNGNNNGIVTIPSTSTECNKTYCNRVDRVKLIL